MRKTIRIFTLGIALAVGLAAIPVRALAQYYGSYNGANGTKWTRPSYATNSLILQHSIRWAQIKRRSSRTTRRQRTARSQRRLAQRHHRTRRANR